MFGVGLILLFVAAKGMDVAKERTFWCLVGFFIALVVVYTTTDEQEKPSIACNGVTNKRESQSNSLSETSPSIRDPSNEASQMAAG